MPFDPNQSAFWNEGELDRELKRVADICHGCRRCYSLCPSFGDLFQRLDREEVDGEAERLGGADFRSVTDLCYQCKLCFNHCPYTPPHRWDLDFPRLMLRAKAVQGKREGISLQDRFLGRVDLVGRLGTLFAPLANRANHNRAARWLMEKIFGVHHERLLPSYAGESFAKWQASRPAAYVADAKNKAALFYTCSVNYHIPEVGRAAVKVLERNRVGVACPAQRCCGMPYLDAGDIDAARRNARANIAELYPLVQRGYDVVVPGPTCSYVLKQEYPLLSPGEAANAVAVKTFDLCEYLMRLHSAGDLDTNFVKPAGTVVYQIPCHLRAQNIGFKSRDLLALIPGTRVRLIEKCSAIDGTWGLKRQYFDLSLKVAAPLIAEIAAAAPDLVVSDCPLSALQIEQGTGRKSLHPVQVLADAYGLENGAGR
jgi:Fe-S oxidoreductase